MWPGMGRTAKMARNNIDYISDDESLLFSKNSHLIPQETLKFHHLFLFLLVILPPTHSPPLMFLQALKPLVFSSFFNIYLAFELVCHLVTYIEAQNLLRLDLYGFIQKRKGRAQVWSCDSKGVLELLQARCKASQSLEVGQAPKPPYMWLYSQMS